MDVCYFVESLVKSGGDSVAELLVARIVRGLPCCVNDAVHVVTRACILCDGLQRSSFCSVVSGLARGRFDCEFVGGVSA